MTALQAIALVLVAVTGTVVVLVPAPDRQAIAAGLFGLCLGLLFFLFQAPDVALSEIVIGGVAMPGMILLALGKVRRQRRDQAEQGEAGDG